MIAVDLEFEDLRAAFRRIVVQLSPEQRWEILRVLVQTEEPER
jgi:hypothetical protein